MKTKVYSDIIQGSDEWKQLKLGRITASEAKDFLGTESAFEKLIHRKAAEILTNDPGSDFLGNKATDRGHMMEPRSRILYEMRHGSKVHEIGFISVDDFFGLSPDGLIGDSEGWESKSINQTDHLFLYEANKKGCPEKSKSYRDHLKQCELSIFLSGRDLWNLVYYHNRFSDEYCMIEFDVHLDQDTNTLCQKRYKIASEFLNNYKRIKNG